jgi:integrase
MIISYATQAGRTAADGRGRNSPYTTAFLKNIEATEEIGTIFRNVTSDVYAAADSKQLPELSLSLIGNFYLKGRPEPTTGACHKANLPQCTPHSLRKAVATELAHRGATTKEIMAITGHQTLAEVERYSLATEDKRHADAAMKRLRSKRRVVHLTNMWAK